MLKKIINIFGKSVDYEAGFMSAVKRSKKWKLEVPEIELSKNPFLIGDRSEAALKVTQEYALKHTAEDVSQQCFGYMYYIKDALEETLQKPLYYTLGYIDYEINCFLYSRRKVKN
ncbi:hypothetical protein GC330_00365 [Yersinia pestis]|uniref:hypothetical protein n=1 Tax=Yersinia pestis TaxID=632 RepID=UPI0001D04401|nr:hypothetical protein [Yersinia pestis]ADE63237.1 hypothetical protein YPZ3_0327 [Yersinia pestis Z176003]MBE7735577.1 hypothetical protein [Yersinia pestis]MBE7739356.1 hypothetical protein [Yersinia pestis]MBE7743805.1 hypothetical protein [Yersinia pestis]MBE7751323.1 hypothetical protein [Yersinia pestis]